MTEFIDATSSNFPSSDGDLSNLDDRIIEVIAELLVRTWLGKWKSWPDSSTFFSLDHDDSNEDDYLEDLDYE